MPSYYLNFNCAMCGEIATSVRLGISSYKQEELFAEGAKYDATCANGHTSSYSRDQMVAVHRKLSAHEKETESELLGDSRFVDI